MRDVRSRVSSGPIDAVGDGRGDADRMAGIDLVLEDEAQ